MGTRLDVVMPDVEPAHGRAVFQSIADEVARLEGRLSRFRRTSFVTRINLEAGDRPVRLDEEMWSLLTRCAELHRRTSGAFDVTVLPLLQLWGFTGEHPPDKRPSAAEILSVRDRVGMEKLIFDATSAAVRFSVDGMKIDFGAVGKGLALERVEVILRESGIASALVNFGDSSILVVGPHPLGGPWPIGVRRSDEDPTVLHTWATMDTAISSSGGANQSMTIDGSSYGHVVDPRTGVPTDAGVLVSVLATSAVEAEALSTALTVLDSPADVLRNFDAQGVAVDRDDRVSSYGVRRVV
jgi:thiamine biosynthesis lipoprotein